MGMEYWHCFIGPVERKTLPQGSDFPMRMAVREAFANLCGEDVEEKSICASGWGVDQEEYDEIKQVQHKHFLKRWRNEDSTRFCK